MPYSKTAIASLFKPVFKKWAKESFTQMQSADFSHELSPSVMRNKTATKFAEIAGGMHLEFTTKLNSAMLQGIVVTSNGAAPPTPLSISSVSHKFKKVFQDGAMAAFMTMQTAEFSYELPQSEMQKILGQQYSQSYGNMAFPFAKELKDALSQSGWTALVEPAIASDFKPVFEKAALESMKGIQNLPFSYELPQSEMQSLITNSYAESFSLMADPFAEKLIKTFKSSPVSTSVGTGSIN